MKQIAKLQEQLAALSTKRDAEIEKVLTDDQRSEIARLKSERKARSAETRRPSGPASAHAQVSVGSRLVSTNQCDAWLTIGRRDVPVTRAGMIDDVRTAECSDPFDERRMHVIAATMMVVPAVLVTACHDARSSFVFDTRLPACGFRCIFALISSLSCSSTEDLSVSCKMRRTTVFGASPPQEEPCSK